MRPDFAADKTSVARLGPDMAGVSCGMAGLRKSHMTMASIEVRTSVTPVAARRIVIELVREARAAGRQVTTADVMRATGRGSRQARRLLNAALVDAAGTVEGPEAKAA